MLLARADESEAARGAWAKGRCRAEGRLTRRLNSANHPSLFGQRLRMLYPAMLHRAGVLCPSVP
jgi:hypothetical protein